MSQKAVITLSSYDRKGLELVLFQLKRIHEETGVMLSDIDPIPPQKIPVPVKSDAGYQLNYLDLYHLDIFLDAEERALRKLMRINVPDGVNIEIIMRTRPPQPLSTGTRMPPR